VKLVVDIQQLAGIVGFQTYSTGSQRIKSKSAVKKQTTLTANIRKYNTHLCQVTMVILRRKTDTDALLKAIPIMRNLDSFMPVSVNSLTDERLQRTFDR
jgi:hypothetical protein